MFTDDKENNNPNKEVAERDNPDTVENLYKAEKPIMKEETKSNSNSNDYKSTSPKFFKTATLVMTISTIFVSVLAVVSLTIAIVNMLKKKAVKDSEETVINVSVKEMKPELFELELSLNAELKSLTGSVNILAPVSGTYTQNNVRLGDRVKKGDILGTVDATDIGLSYNSAPVYAKADGVITSISSYVNQKVSTSTVLYTIEQDPDFVLSASVSESDVEDLKLGILGRFTTAGNKEKIHTAHLTYISPSVDTTSRTVAIELTVDNTEENLEGLRSGNYVSLSLLKSQIDDALVIPRSAIRTYDTGDAVFTIDSSNIAHKKDIIIGDSDQVNAVVESGISIGDKVITKGSPQDGEEVQVL